MKFVLALIVAGAADAIEFFVPVLSAAVAPDIVIDVITFIILSLLGGIGPSTVVVAVLEGIPVVDISPTWLIYVIVRAPRFFR